MADPISVVSRLTDVNTYKKYAIYLLLTLLLLLLFRGVWSLLFKPQQQVNKPITVVTPFATVQKGGIDQSNTQVLVTEKSWQADVFGGGVQYDNKNGVFFGGRVSKKW